ncbi:hypothetical protein CY34DRAFT_111364, partial [Suillus luteus UH-Slu-Lm8-n1]
VGLKNIDLAQSSPLSSPTDINMPGHMQLAKDQELAAALEAMEGRAKMPSVPRAALAATHASSSRQKSKGSVSSGSARSSAVATSSVSTSKRQRRDTLLKSPDNKKKPRQFNSMDLSVEMSNDDDIDVLPDM